jgi:hypothetical protein
MAAEPTFQLGSGMGSIAPSQKMQPAIPSARNAAAMVYAQVKECVAAATYPVRIGAAMAENWLQKFVIPPTLPAPTEGQSGMELTSPP